MIFDPEDFYVCEQCDAIVPVDEECEECEE